MKMKIAATLMLATSCAHANFADCVLNTAPGTTNAPAAFAVFKSCTNDYPNQYYDLKRGDGLGLFGFKNPEACIIKKSRDTAQSNAALMIANACRCLYTEPSFPGEMCAYRQN